MPRVKIKVVDRDSGREIPYVFVKLGREIKPTCHNGCCEFNISRGIYKLDVRSPAHSPYSNNILVDGDKEITIKITKATL